MQWMPFLHTDKFFNSSAYPILEIIKVYQKLLIKTINHKFIFCF